MKNFQHRIAAATAAMAVMASVALAITHPAHAAEPGKPAKSLSTAASQQLLQRLADESALRDLMYAYGRGNDELSIHHANRKLAKERGAAEYSKAFTPSTRVEVYALGGDKAIGQLVGVPAWVDFVDQYYGGNGYSSTLHLMSNFEFGFDGPNQARITAYALAPHFFLRAAARDKASADTAVEWMLCRYAALAERQADGSWKLSRLQINLEEMSRAAGFFPGGQRDGR
ncbi:nuclear transport factor 2 family protein [Roseateles puraquae]|uniref:SnoaL-like domain-containing protein n=1 Tax=Roseateles puraquae TaxID=431059 RepID=A0A254N3Z0_9BURK|nr:nuclear transport factor 2 family protein [Roseateles puraquae]MDG0853762.1 hypothetical protein [Roseateles puraquae]OWR02805.1 hypothetical protein CDO81_18460 [Roseateles puraquae]